MSIPGCPLVLKADQEPEVGREQRHPVVPLPYMVIIQSGLRSGILNYTLQNRNGGKISYSRRVFIFKVGTFVLLPVSHIKGLL